MLDVFEYLFDRFKAKQDITHVVDGQPYAVKEDGTLGLPVRKLAPQFVKPVLALSSLAGLVTAYKAKLDDFPDGAVAFHVTSPTSVDLIDLKADEFGVRHIYARSSHVENAGFQFNKYYAPEDFLIAFRAGFLFNEYAVKVQRLCSSLSTQSGVAVADDGLSQTVTVTEGAVTRTAVELPPEIPLTPWRTFREAAPVESKFLLRLKNVKDSLPMVAIFEIDGKWKLDTIAAIERYLTTHLPKAVVIS